MIFSYFVYQLFSLNRMYSEYNVNVLKYAVRLNQQLKTFYGIHSVTC